MIYSLAYYCDDEDALLSGWRADEWILVDRRGQWVASKLECNNTANKSIALRVCGKHVWSKRKRKKR